MALNLVDYAHLAHTSLNQEGRSVFHVVEDWWQNTKVLCHFRTVKQKVSFSRGGQPVFLQSSAWLTRTIHQIPGISSDLMVPLHLLWVSGKVTPFPNVNRHRLFSHAPICSLGRNVLINSILVVQDSLPVVIPQMCTQCVSYVLHANTQTI